MDRYRKLGKNIALLTIGNFASKVLSFLLVPLYTAVLSTQEYGTADLVATSVNLIIPLTTCLIYESTLRFALDKSEDRRQLFSIGFWLTNLGSLAIIILAQFLRLTPVFSDYVSLFILYYISLVFFNLVMQYVKGIEKVRVYAVAGVLNTFVYIFSNIVLLLLLRVGVKGYLLAFVIGHTVSAMYALWFSRAYRDLISWKKIRREKVVEMLKYSIPMIPNAVSWWISNSSDKYILLLFWGTAVNGLYSVAYKIPSILTMVINIFIGAWQISAVDEFGSEVSRKFYSDIYRKYEALLFTGGAILILGTKILASFLFSDDFFQAWMYTPVLILASVFNSMAAFVGSIYTSAKKTSMLFLSTLVAAFVNIILNFLLIPEFSGMGAAVATLISYAVVWLIRVVDSKKIMELQVNYMVTFAACCVTTVEIVFVCLSDTWLSVPALLCTATVIGLYSRRLIQSLTAVVQKLRK